MADKIIRRHVFYVPGFDPRGARLYHGMYSEHAKKQSAINGLDLSVSPRRKISDISHIWHVTGNRTTTEFEYLSWSDIVRQHWKNGVAALLADSWLCFRSGLINGVIFRFLRVRKSLFRLAVLYPFLYLPLAFFLAIWIGNSLIDTKAQGGDFAFSALIAAGASLLFLWAGLKLGHKIAIFWLLRIFCFSIRWSQGKAADLEDRINAFSARLREEILTNRADEIMVVGHSAGAMLAVPVIARALKSLPADTPAQQIAFLTLSNCIPMISFMPWAEAYRKELAEVANDPRVIWIDYSAPPDGASFSQIDPVIASGCDAPAGPHMLSPRFHRLYEEKKYRRLKYNWFKLHFLYLQSSDKKGAYDYFDLTAGPTPFAARFATEGPHE